MLSDAPTTTTGGSSIQVEGSEPITINPFDAGRWNPMIYDGEKIIVVTRDVYRNPLIDLTKRGSRRTR